MTYIKRSPPATSTLKYISNGLVYFSHGQEVCAPNDKISIYCIILCLFGVSIHWSAKNQPSSAAHSKDSEVSTFYLSTKMVQWIRPILQNLGFQVSYAPNPKYEYSQPTFVIIKGKHLTIRVKHIFVPMNYVHNQYVLLAIDHIKLKPPFGQQI